MADWRGQSKSLTEIRVALDRLQVASEAPRHVPEGKTVTEEEKTARAGQGDDGEKCAESSNSASSAESVGAFRLGKTTKVV